MKVSIRIILLLFLFASFFACQKENPLEKERKEFTKTLEDDIPLNVYKGIKLTLRSLSINKNEKNIDSLFSGLQKSSSKDKNTGKYTVHLLKLLLGSGNSENTLTIKETIEMLKVYNKLKDEIKDQNEDDFPTLLEVLLLINNLKNNGAEELIKELNWNNSKEHLVLSAGLMGANPLPKSFRLYEISKLDIPKLENTEIKPLAAIFKAIILFQDKWVYLSEEALTQGIESLDAGNLQFEYANFPSLFNGTKINSREAEIIQFHGMSCVMRGYLRIKMDNDEKNELAVKDFEMFLEDADKIGADNELVWLTGTYVSIKKEDGQKAIMYLEKLEYSPNFSDKEKTSFRDIKRYLSDRKSDKALNLIYDRIFIGKLAMAYLSAYISEINWYNELVKSEAGKQLLSIPQLIDSEYQKVEKEMSPDRYKDKGKELLDSIFKIKISKVILPF